MFAFVSAFPKSLHCTDEAQQAETVLSAVLSIYIYIYSVFKRISLLNIAGRDKNTVTGPWFRLTLFRSQRQAEHESTNCK